MTLLASARRQERPAPTGPGGEAGVPGPLRQVVAALEDGANTRSRVVLATGLDRDLVDSALDHLMRLGRVRAEPLASGCPASGCGACPSGQSDESAGCGALTRSAGRGPVAVTLVGRRPG